MPLKLQEKPWKDFFLIQPLYLLVWLTQLKKIEKKIDFDLEYSTFSPKSFTISVLVLSKANKKVWVELTRKRISNILVEDLVRISYCPPSLKTLFSLVYRQFLGFFQCLTFIGLVSLSIWHLFWVYGLCTFCSRALRMVVTLVFLKGNIL